MAVPSKYQLPPKWMDSILQWYCHEELLEDLQGDLHEIFQSKYESIGHKRARLYYFWLIIRSFRLNAIKKPKLNSNTMIKTQNFKIAARVLWRDKFNTVLNTVGLTIGILCFLLLGMYVVQEVSFDRFHSQKDRIYRVWLLEDYGDGKIFFNAQTPYRFESLLEDNFPEVERAIQYMVRNYPVSQDKNNYINETVAYISPDFLQVFDFELLEGTREELFTGKFDVVISEKYAEKYFGAPNAIGEKLYVQIGEDVREFTVSAILENFPVNSGIQFDIALSSQFVMEQLSERVANAWMTVDPETYILLSEKASISAIEDKMQDVIMSLSSGEFNRGEYSPGFQPLTEIHLNPEIPLGNVPVNNPKYVYIMAVLGVLVLIIASINYATLSVGKSLKRTREVGMRKVLGAEKSSLILQYLSESFLIAFISSVIGSVLSIALVPVFNNLTGLDLIYTFQWWHLLIVFGLALAIGFLSGIYPSLVLSNTKIIRMLMNSQGSKSNHTIRKVMVTFQFIVTVFLISSSLIVKKQLEYIQNKDLGYNYDASIYVPIHSDADNGNLLTRVQSAVSNAQILKNSLSKYTEINNVTMSSHTFGNPGWANLAFTDKDDNFRRFRLLQVDADYFEAFDIDLEEGRLFEPGNGLDQRQSVILNQAAVEYFEFDNPIGKSLPGNEFGEHQIIGVVEDFNFSSLHYEIEPLIIVQNILPIYMGISDGDIMSSVLPKLQFKYSGNNLLKVEEILKDEWQKAFPNRKLEFGFMDELINQQYQQEARLNKLTTIGTIISVIIASIGLLGLTVLVINSKEKELGIRKIMGASPAQLFRLLISSFSIQLIIGVILSIPITLYLMNSWLDEFAYRTSPGILVFVISAIISIVISVLVISFHTWKAALINPVNSLRSE